MTNLDFNQICLELIKRLRLSGQTKDGTIYWYEGTIPLLRQMMEFIPNEEES